MASFWKSTATTLEMIKWEHSVFALPFALTGAVLAAGGWPTLRVLGWIVVCMVAARSAAADSPLASLTPRETEVLEQLAQGKNNAAIAMVLFLTERAVEKHINSIFSKLQLSEEKEIHRRVKVALLYLGKA